MTSETVEPLSRAIIENMVAAGQIYWRRPLPLIPRRWAWAFAAGAMALVVVAVVAFPSL